MLSPAVLVVDDLEVNRRVAELMLVWLGYRVLSADSGLAALEVLAHTRCAAILMDCGMPGMDGFAVTAEIRRREAADQHTPIIAMTGRANAADRDACLAAGMDDCLPKPVKLPALVRVLGRWAATAHILAAPATGVPPTSHARRVLDPQTLDQIRALEEPGYPSVLMEMVQTFGVSFADYLGRLKQALSAGNVDTFRDAAHALKGAAASMGAEHVRDVAHQLERRQAHWSQTEAQQEVAELEEAGAQAMAALLQQVANPT